MDSISEVKTIPVFKSLLLTIARNQVSKELYQTLAEILSKSKYQDDKTLNDFLNYLRKKMEDTQPFTTQLEKIQNVAPQLYKHLETNCPELTRSERGICVLAGCGFGTKEIARIRSSTPGATKMALFRIRKKLGLRSSSDLQSYLYSIDSSPKEKVRD